MSQYRSASGVAGALRTRAKRARRSIDAENREIAERMRAHAIKLTSGQIPESQIRKYRYFAKNGNAVTRVEANVGARPNGRKRVRVTARGGSAPILPINSHSGKLQRSLRVIRVRNGYRLQFTAPYSKYVLATGGTKTMIDRGFWKEMQRRASNERARSRKRVLADLKQ